MRDIVTAPIFIRLGARQRAPDGAEIASIRRVNISNVVASGVDPRYSAIIAGLNGHDIEDVRLTNIQIQYKGGGNLANASREIPEGEKSYPEPSMFGVTPASAFYIRHARGITFNNVTVSFETPDPRPRFVVDDVKGIQFFRTNAQQTSDAKLFSLKNVLNFVVSESENFSDIKLARVDHKIF
jgi:polygalacturonase